ncbi:MAG: hypothetical protein Q7J79_03180, partial [Gemmatimonadales bacterium]|nr:hypothetical protein [Gemmatimonadales bacterium]
MAYQPGEFARLAATLGSVQQHVGLTANQVRRDYPHWKEGWDARITVFAKFANTVSNATVGAVCLDRYLTSPAWWVEVGAPRPDERMLTINLLEFS